MRERKFRTNKELAPAGKKKKKNLPQLRLKPILAYLHRPHVYLHAMYSALETGPHVLMTLFDEDNNHHNCWVECPESHMENWK